MMILSRKIHLKMTFPVSLKEMIFTLENLIFLPIETLNMIGRASVINVNNSLNKFVLIYLIPLICKNLIHLEHVIKDLQSTITVIIILIVINNS